MSLRSSAAFNRLDGRSASFRSLGSAGAMALGVYWILDDCWLLLAEDEVRRWTKGRESKWGNGFDGMKVWLAERVVVLIAGSLVVVVGGWRWQWQRVVEGSMLDWRGHAGLGWVNFETRRHHWNGATARGASNDWRR